MAHESKDQEVIPALPAKPTDFAVLHEKHGETTLFTFTREGLEKYVHQRILEMPA